MTLRRTPSPADEWIDPALDKAFVQAQADWRAVRGGIAADLFVCPQVRPAPKLKGAAGAAAPAETGDRWLSQEFAGSLLELANALKLEVRGRRELLGVLQTAKLRTVTLPARVRLLTDRTVANHTVSRREACPILKAYLDPLLDPDAYRRWLGEMARGQFFFRGAQSTAPVPMAVVRREQARDRELLERWSGSPPQLRDLAPNASPRDRERAQRAYQKNLEAYERQRRRAGAMLATDPNALPFSAGSGDITRLGRQHLLPLITIGGTAAPANLFISEAAPVLGDYFGAMRAVLSAADPSLGVAAGFAGLAYGVLALAAVPLYCLYDTFHGTCAVETVTPRLLASLDAIVPASQRALRELVDERMSKTLWEVKDKDAEQYLTAFLAWIKTFTLAMRTALFHFLGIAAEQGGGRIRTPVAFTSDGQWSFSVDVQADDGSTQTLALTAPETLSYETQSASGSAPVSSRDTEADIFWMLPALWEPVATAVALANQSGARVWLNAANNRWGGHHPPHRVHRKGVSLDVDVGLAWRTDKVQNVVKRDYIGFALPDTDVPGNSRNAECLHFMERIAGWIVTQAFVLVGVSQYLYGDAGLVEQATLHLQQFFSVRNPARMDGILDADGHSDHWHFELVVGERPTRAGEYVLQVADAGVFTRLHELALARDNDPAFWSKFAGLEAVPTRPENFDGLVDAADWRRWWALRDGPGGVPWLPVWAPSQAGCTFAANQCWAPKGDFPDAFKPGDVPV